MKTNLNPDKTNVKSFYFDIDVELENLILKYQDDFEILSVINVDPIVSELGSFKVFFIRKS